MQEGRPTPGGERQSIWSVPRHLWLWFIVLFSIQYVIFLGLTIWNEIASRGDSGTVQIILNVQKEMTASILNMAAGTYLILEGVMLAQWLRERDQRKREEKNEEVRKLARGEERQKWMEWLERMQSAEKKGLPFDEPPPGASDPE